jgi:hypothetical protein
MSAEEILNSVVRVTGLPLAAIRSRRQGDHLPHARALIALVMRDELQATHAEISAALGKRSLTAT